MNELLYWMSARRAGAVQSFRSRVAELGAQGADGSYRRTVEWNLSKLAHAEFAPAAGSDGWRVAPPVLAAGDRTGRCSAVLCGARTPLLFARLLGAAGADRIRVAPQAWGPDIAEVSADSALQLEAIATASGIRLQWNAPLALLACCVPPKRLVLQPAEIPIGGWTVAQFDKATLGWVGSTQQAASSARFGLFRFRSDYATAYVVIEEGQAWACEPASGKYRILKRKNRALSYSSADDVLSIHAGCRPPALIERALVLCSGGLPRYDGGRLIYSRVDVPVAAAVAAVLDQRVV